jgi:hypothetical protein
MGGGEGEVKKKKGFKPTALTCRQPTGGKK